MSLGAAMRRLVAVLQVILLVALGFILCAMLLMVIAGAAAWFLLPS